MELKEMIEEMMKNEQLNREHAREEDEHLYKPKKDYMKRINKLEEDYMKRFEKVGILGLLDGLADLELNNPKKKEKSSEMQTYEKNLDNVFDLIGNIGVLEMDESKNKPKDMFDDIKKEKERLNAEYDQNTIRAKNRQTETVRKPANPVMREIKRVIFNDPATIVYWKDGTRTVVEARSSEKFDQEKGLAMAIVKKACGNTRDYYDVFLKYAPKEARSHLHNNRRDRKAQKQEQK